MTTILREQNEFDVVTQRASPGLWLAPADLERVTGFALKPQGLCKDEICVPVPRDAASFLDAAGDVDAAAFWRYMGHPVVHDEASDTWAFGTGAGARRQSMETLEAPDFSLPDVEGRMHALSDFRGKKILLATWASW